MTNVILLVLPVRLGVIIGALQVSLDIDLSCLVIIMRLSLMTAKHFARQLLNSFEDNWNVISVRDCRLLEICLMYTQRSEGLLNRQQVYTIGYVANWYCSNWLQL